MSNGVVLRLGARGGKVRALQAALNRAGLAVPTDGVFGPATEQALRRAQRSHGLVADGVAGPVTLQALAVHQHHATATAAGDGAGGDDALSPQGAAFIGHFEGFSSKLYNDPAGHCTIGFGHLVHHGPINGSEPEEFKRGITRERALELLREDAREAAAVVNTKVKRGLTVNQRDALIDFTYNVGGGAFASSTLLRLLNEGDFSSVPAQFNRWTLAGGRPLPGLVRRRAAEGALFSKGVYVS